jgi:hypothetical protein
MPINPQIVTAQLPGIQIENPMTFARNALAMKQAQSEIAANELAAREAQGFNQLVSASRQPGGVALTPDVLMQAGLFKKAKELQEAQNAMTTGQKEENTLVGAEMDLSRRMLEGISALPPDQKANAYVQWHEMQHTNPVLQRYFKRIGLDKSQADARIQAALQQPGGLDQLIAQSALGLEKAMARNFVTMDLGATKEVISMPSVYPGRAETVPGSQRTVTESPNRPQNITTVEKGDTAEEVEKAKDRVKEYSTIRDRAVQGRRTLPSLQRAASALNKFETGFGAEATTEARRVLVSLGLADVEAAEKVKSADSFAVAVKDRILFKLSQQAGTQTEGDAQRAEDTWASYRKLTDSNKFLIDLEKAVIAQDNEQLKFYDDWEAENGTYRGAAQAWRDGPGSKSLFDRPEMKKYADRESAAQSAANPIRVKTVEEAENLPPGTVFITPNGKRKVR